MPKAFSLSRLVLGMMRLPNWNFSNKQLLNFLKASEDLGIKAIDLADIYGNYSCEELFGKAIKLDSSFRPKIRIISKCGINILSDKYPKRKTKYYDTSYGHIMESVEASLRKIGTDYLDVLLIHRPNPFFNPGETARALNQLVDDGKVLQIGVSNFLPIETDLLSSHLKHPICYNQIELSLLHNQALFNGELTYMQLHKIRPMAWSPLAGGKLMQKDNKVLVETAKRIAKENNLKDISQVFIAWLAHHPAGIISVLGTGNIKHVEWAVQAQTTMIPREHIFELLEIVRQKPIA